MARQLMIYNDATPIDSTRHREVSVQPTGGYGFAAGINSVPLVAAEFERAAPEYPIVFAGKADGMHPAAVLGLKADENRFLLPDGRWDSSYVPAFLRRYPFVFAEKEGEDTLVLCIDTEYAGVNSEGRGERLFDSDGNRTRYLQNMMDFTSDYQRQHNVTRAMTARLDALGLLETAEAKITRPDGEVAALTGFQRVNADRLADLDDATALELYRNGTLGLCYMHLASLGQLHGLAFRRGDSAAPAAGAAVAQPEPAPTGA